MICKTKLLTLLFGSFQIDPTVVRTFGWWFLIFGSVTGLLSNGLLLSFCIHRLQTFTVQYIYIQLEGPVSTT